MDSTIRLRKVNRTAFSRLRKLIMDEIANPDANKAAIRTTFTLLEREATELKALDSKILVLMIEGEQSEQDLDREMLEAEAYQREFLETSALVQERWSRSPVVGNHDSESEITHGNKGRKIKLPKLELRKFDGDVREWVNFWSQFEKIHTDDELSASDKFQYLIQATVPGSRAREIVESFPPKGENYENAVDCLKARFGREDLLVEVYVRDLLSLVMQDSRSTASLAHLYDKVESHLRALETLGISPEKCAALLFPLVESCLPRELLQAWHRSSHFRESAGSPNKQLEQLMKFVKGEVEGEERISLAESGFAVKAARTKSAKSSTKRAQEDVPTASELLTTSKVSANTPCCVFCKGRHASEDCFAAQKLSLTEKQKTLKDVGACFSCLKLNHSSRSCKARLRCLLCTKKHVPLMCPRLEAVQSSPESRSTAVGIAKPSSSPENRPETSNLTNLGGSPQVYLQTLVVELKGKRSRRRVRALIDSGSQRSYILQSTASELGCDYQGEEPLVHSLFGGLETTQRVHRRFKAQVTSIDGRYSCSIDALDHPKICGDIGHIKYGPWIQELAREGIQLSDYDNSEHTIELLIGADVAGRLLTGQRRMLSCGLVAIETHLGWTLMGKVPRTASEAQAPSSLASTVTSMLIIESSPSELWRLDVIGITDLIEQKSRKERDLETKAHFLENVRVNEDRRYEIRLPWIEGHPHLPSARQLAEKRLISTTKRLISENLYEEYDGVFKEWLKRGIIERAPLEDHGTDEHYLPHHPVIRESSATTRVRPVFDASARVGTAPSLNQCLETGPNLLEQVFSCLVKFRENKIGVTSDIEKAFLQISVHPVDRDCLRFLWWESKEIADGIFYWSDSSVVLSWIKRNEVWSTFVNNRIREIRNSSKPTLWQYIPGPSNPADIPSRGCSLSHLVDSPWWEGPAWLKEESRKWPTQLFDRDEAGVSRERPLQRIFPLEIGKDDDLCQEFQSRKGNRPPAVRSEQSFLSADNPEQDVAQEPVYVTRSGRQVRLPHRLGL